MPMGTSEFAITAAALIVGGGILLRYQRDRHHFLLMKAAIEKGITAFPGATPGWLISLRVGTLSLVMGIGLLVVGIFLHIHTSDVVVTGGANTPLPPGYVSPENGVRRPPPAAPANGPQSDAPPPPPSPEMERQHRIENQELVGKVAFCAGIILMMLGTVRILFSRLERKYVGESMHSSPLK